MFSTLMANKPTVETAWIMLFVCVCVFVSLKEGDKRQMSGIEDL